MYIYPIYTLIYNFYIYYNMAVLIRRGSKLFPKNTSYRPPMAQSRLCRYLSASILQHSVWRDPIPGKSGNMLVWRYFG
jgi:hypothetical protein